MGRASASFIALALALCPSLSARASEAALAAAFYYDRDGAVVAVDRVAGATEGPGRTAIRLFYPRASRTVEAEIDRSAILGLTPGAHPTDLELEGVRIVRPLMPAAGLWLIEATSPDEDGVDAARRAAHAPGVRHATPNLYLRVTRTADPYVPNDPRLPGQWYFDNLEMSTAWGLSLGSADTSIVIVDTGCDLDHPDLAAKMDPGLDVVDGDDDPTYDISEPGAAHGTACAGVAAAVTDNGEGIAGACPLCRLRCVRLITDAPLPISATVDAFQFALEVNASVVSNSWGYVDPTPVHPAIADAIAALFEQGRDGRGALVFFAAGNDNREVTDDEIGAAHGVFNIGAINNFDESTPFTNFGNSLDLVAPTGTLTTDIVGPDGDDPTDYTSSFGGTSSACPVAAGIGGLLVSAAPERTAAELYEVMLATARPAPFAEPNAAGHDPIYGFGIIDPVAALEALLGTPEPPTGAGGGGGGAGGAAAESEGDSGCGCEMVGARNAGALGLLGYGLVLALSLARRRRRTSDQHPTRPSASTHGRPAAG